MMKDTFCIVDGGAIEEIVGNKETEELISLVPRARLKRGVSITADIQGAGRVLLKNIVNSCLK